MNTNPTTVRGWLETLPEPLKSKIVSDCTCPNEHEESLTMAILASTGWVSPPFHVGVYKYILGIEIDSVNAEYHEGYNAAKAAYEAQEKRKTEVRDCCRCGSTLPETEFEGFEQTCNDCLKSPKGDWVGVGPIESPAYQVKEVWEQTHDTLEGKTLVDNHLLALLQEKAAKWDELQQTLRRLKIC